MKYLLALAAFVTVWACQSKPESIVGAWTLQASDEWVQQSEKVGNAPPAGEFVFNADGTCRMVRAADGGRMEAQGRYEVEGDKVTFIVNRFNGEIAPPGQEKKEVGYLEAGRSRFNINGLTFVR